MRQNLAETIALQALAWIAADQDMLGNFCGATGTTPGDLRRAAEEPEFLAGVLDFLILDDAWVQAFADATGLSPETPLRARSVLPGGAAPHWT